MIAVGVMCVSAGATRGDEARILARVGDSLPGGDGGSVTISRFGGFTNAFVPIVTDVGAVYFSAEVTGTGVTSANNRGIWRCNSNGSHTLVARIGQGAWAPQTGLYFSAVAPPMVHVDGTCAFQGVLGGTNVTASNARSFWSFDGSNRRMLVREGLDGASGLDPNTDLSALSETVWTKTAANVGRLVFKASLVNGDASSANNRVVGDDDEGGSSARALARAGSPIPQLMGGSLTCKEPNRVTNSVGESIVYSSLMGTNIVSASTVGALPNDQVIFRPGQSQPIARAGAAISTNSPWRLYSLFSTSAITKPQFNRNNTVVFVPTLCDASNVPTQSGVWCNQGGQLRPVLMPGEQAPGLPAGVMIAPVAASAPSSMFALCDNDDVIVVCNLVGVGVTYGNDRAMFRIKGNGEKALIVRGGQQVPGAQQGVVVSNEWVGRFWRANAIGNVVMIVNVVGTGVWIGNDVCMLSNVGGPLQMVAREGDSASADGTVFIENIMTSGALHLNNQGQSFFLGVAHGPSLVLPSTWFRVNHDGEVRPFAMSREVVAGQTGVEIRTGVLSPSAPFTVSNTGQVVTQNLLDRSADAAGDAIVSWMIASDSSGTSGACCNGTACVVGPPAACASGVFQSIGSVCSVAANPTTCCKANFNRVDGVSVQDLFDFLTAYFARAPEADFNDSGLIGPQDIFDFMELYLTGC